MKKYGIDNVRGGSYSQIELKNDEIRILKKEMNTSGDCCYKCGSLDHFIQDCKENEKQSWWKRIEYFAYDLFTQLNTENVCYRCGHPSHYANNCYARYDVYGNKL